MCVYVCVCVFKNLLPKPAQNPGAVCPTKKGLGMQEHACALSRLCNLRHSKTERQGKNKEIFEERLTMWGGNEYNLNSLQFLDVYVFVLDVISSTIKLFTYVYL